jgi:hypothetical protein
MAANMREFHHYIGEVVYTGLVQQGLGLVASFVEGALEVYSEGRELEEEGSSEVADPEFSSVMSDILSRGVGVVEGTSRSVFGGHGVARAVLEGNW